MTRIERKEWRKLARIGWFTRFYVETLTIMFIMREILPPMNFFLSALMIVALAIGIEKVTRRIVRYIKGFYEIIDVAPVADHDYIENGEKQKRAAPTKPTSSVRHTICKEDFAL